MPNTRTNLFNSFGVSPVAKIRTADETYRAYTVQYCCNIFNKLKIIINEDGNTSVFILFFNNLFFSANKNGLINKFSVVKFNNNYHKDHFLIVSYSNFEYSFLFLTNYLQKFNLQMNFFSKISLNLIISI